MCISKICYSLAATGLLLFSNVVSAAVYDFGSSWISSYAYTNKTYDFSVDAVVNPMRFIFATSLVSQLDSGAANAPQASVASIYSPNVDNVPGLPYKDSGKQFQNGGYDKDSGDDRIKGPGQYTSIAAPVLEPETYAMILAGLVMIGYTARRRNRIV